MHAKRLVVALVLVPLLYMYVMYLPEWSFLLLLGAVSTVALAEFYRLADVRGPLAAVGLALGAGLLAMHFYRNDLIGSYAVLSVLCVTTVRLFRKGGTVNATREAGLAAFGIAYVPGLLSVQLDILKSGPAWLAMLYFGVWGADSMAYYAGKSIGRRKLYEAVSPNKTMEGAGGSILGGIIGVFLIKFFLLSQVTILEVFLLGAVIGFTTIFGDLVESMFKRDAGIKDSGTVMPGHGGFLDKIDGATFAGPAFYACCLFLKYI